PKQLLAVELHATAINSCSARQEADDGEAGGSLAGAGLADESQTLTSLDAETCAVQRVNNPPATHTDIGCPQVRDVEERLRGHDVADLVACATNRRRGWRRAPPPRCIRPGILSATNSRPSASSGPPPTSTPTRVSAEELQHRESSAKPRSQSPRRPSDW